MTYLDRYLAGQHEAVWAELLALGPAVREEPMTTDAWAVARETMRRARHNVAILVERLPKLNYQFACPEEVWLPPSDESLDRLAEAEQAYGPLPMSVRAWHEMVGAVDLRGAYPNLAMYAGLDWGGSDRFWDLHWYSDPLFIDAVNGENIDDTWFDDNGEERPGPPFKLFIAPDAIHKSNISGGNAMALHLPVSAIDGVLLGSGWKGLEFVRYLRTCFRWAGFPGLGRVFPWSRRPPDPARSRAERAFLSEGMLPL